MTAQRSRSRLFLAGGLLLVLAAIVFAQQAFNLNSFISPSNSNEILLLYALSTLVFLVLLVFGFILLRILVKTWIERRDGKPGSRFKTSLLGMLAVLTLIPAVSVFAFAYGLVNRSIDKWLSAPVDQIVHIGERMVSDNREWEREQAQALMAYLAADPPENFNAARSLLKLRGLLLLDANGQIEKATAEPDLAIETHRPAVLRAIAGKSEDVIQSGDEWIAIRRLNRGGESQILAAALPVRGDVSALAAAILQAKTGRDQLKAQQLTFRETYVTLLALMTVLVLLASVWLAIFLSKRVTGPIEALAAATREISKGNLDYRVQVTAVDELGMLVELFNNMASRLQLTTAELESRRRYIEIVLENIPTGVISVDADLNVLTLNRAARTMFSVENALTLDHIFSEADLKEIHALLQTATDAPATRELSFQTPARPINSAVTASRLTSGGFVLVVEDITEVIRAQKASAWREVARRLAHEIKNPLTPIQLSAERISRNIARLPATSPRVSAVMHECVSAITDEVASLKNLVDEFVRFARLPTVSRLPNDMRALVDSTLALYEGRIEGIAVDVSVPPDLPPVLMDTAQMKRVLVNLIDNALAALSDQPEPQLKISCDIARQGTMARLMIEDNGSGIDPEDRERLFTPYFSTRKGGTGLGLSIAGRIVSDHGGYIGVETASPRGTRFVIELPLCQESLLSTTNQASASR